MLRRGTSGDTPATEIGAPPRLLSGASLLLTDRRSPGAAGPAAPPVDPGGRLCSSGSSGQVVFLLISLSVISHA